MVDLVFPISFERRKEQKKKEKLGERKEYVLFCGGKEERRRIRRKIFGKGKCNHHRTNNKQQLRKDRAAQSMKAEMSKKSQYCIERMTHTIHELKV